MKIIYQLHLPKNFKTCAADLYFSSLKEKLEPILGNDHRVKDILTNSINEKSCIVAICEDKLVGIMGIQCSKEIFFNPNFGHMQKLYGAISASYRLLGLAILDHKPRSGELYVDGVAVDPTMRGRGIGTRLFGMLEEKACKEGFEMLSLDVVDTNPRAMALYQQLGFEEVKTRSIWPLDLFIGFSFKSATFMTKKLNHE